MRTRRHKDDSNRFVVSLTMFNRTDTTPIAITILVLAAVILWYLKDNHAG